MPETAERVLFVHAHPDDETISTGGTIATLVDRGASVTVLTCTRGERGEVIPKELAHLLESPAALAEYREGELARAMSALGVRDHRYLGGADARWNGRQPRRYRDSGMQWGEHGAEAPDAVGPDSLVAAPFAEVASDIAAVIAAVQPDVVVSYNENGGYGHPDHVTAHEASRKAAQVLGVPFYVIEPRDSGATPSVSVDVAAAFDRKKLALAAHRTQVSVDGDFFALSNGIWQPIDTVEKFRRLRTTELQPSADFSNQSVSGKIVSCVLAVLLGAAIGIIGSVTHQASAMIGGVAVPWGLIAGLAIVAALLCGLRLLFGSRVVPGIAALAVLAAVTLASVQGAGGSVLVPANMSGYIWTYGVVIIAAIVLAWPRSLRRRVTKINTPPAVKGVSPQ